MSTSRGFAGYSLIPIIIICQLRDWSYNTMHFQFKTKWAHLLYALKVSRARGKLGLLRTLRAARLMPVVSAAERDGLYLED